MHFLKYTLFILIAFVACRNVQAKDKEKFTEEAMSVTIDTNKLFGTLTLPVGKKNCPVVLIIAGSGGTNRDGNQPDMNSDAYKQLAHRMAEKGIASLRYDKRGVGESVFNIKEIDLRFDTYIDDVVLWMETLKKDKRFTKLIVAGHSEGSLLGMVAAQKSKADKFISIAGAGMCIDEVLRIQLRKAVTIDEYYFKCCRYLDTLKQGQLLNNADPALATLFRPSIQPYMVSWIKYDPMKEIKKLTIPTLILQGENDVQVEVDNAKRLALAKEDAELVIIKGMNHPLKLAEKDRDKNLETYGDPNLPVVQEAIDTIVAFVLK